MFEISGANDFLCTILTPSALVENAFYSDVFLFTLRANSTTGSGTYEFCGAEEDNYNFAYDFGRRCGSDLATSPDGSVTVSVNRNVASKKPLAGITSKRYDGWTYSTTEAIADYKSVYEQAAAKPVNSDSSAEDQAIAEAVGALLN